MKREYGFTLVEVMLAVVLMAVGVLAVTKAMNGAFLAEADSENTARALQIANNKMEALKDSNYSAIVSSGRPTDPDYPVLDPDYPAFRVSVTAGSADPKQVDVTVNWDTKGGQTSLTLTTYVGNLP